MTTPESPSPTPSLRAQLDEQAVAWELAADVDLPTSPECMRAVAKLLREAAAALVPEAAQDAEIARLRAQVEKLQNLR